MSPGATKDGIILSPTDAYFISTSAVCVTGLVPLNVHEHFTNYGQTILLVLFQVGAFGIMTFTYFVSLMVGQGLSLRSKVTISNLLDEEGIAQVDRFIKNIIAVTFGVEALGAIALYFSWRNVPGLEGDTLWWYAVFHSVSGFCNAGFSLFADNLATPDVAYNMGGQITIMVMVLCGSLGFAMYLEIVRRARVALGWDSRNTISRHWSTYSWLVVRMTAALVLGGGLILFLIKAIDGSLFTSADPWYWILWESLFNATARTAGFNISDMALNSVPYALFLGALMFIGGNPGSTTGRPYHRVRRFLRGGGAHLAGQAGRGDAQAPDCPQRGGARRHHRYPGRGLGRHDDHGHVFCGTGTEPGTPVFRGGQLLRHGRFFLERHAGTQRCGQMDYRV